MTKKLIARSHIVSVAHLFYVQSCGNSLLVSLLGWRLTNENSLKLRLYAYGDLWQLRLYYCRKKK